MMRKIFFVFAIALAVSCTSTVNENNSDECAEVKVKSAVVEKPVAVPNDYNGDGKPDSYRFERMPSEVCEKLPFDEVHVDFIFNDPSIPTLVVNRCDNAIVHELGDLNGDGRAEIGMITMGFHSSWCAYKVYTFVNGKWQELVESFTVFLEHYYDYSEQGKLPVEKANDNTKCYINVSENDFDAGNIYVERKLVNFLSLN